MIAAILHDVNRPSLTRPGAPASVPLVMKHFLFAVCALGVAAGLGVYAQNSNGSPSGVSGARGYVPVTDEMLWKPDPANWLSWRRTLDGLGLQPARSDRPQQRRHAEDGVDARHGHGHRRSDAARLRRRDVPAQPGRRHPGHRRQDRRSASGSIGGSCPRA